MAYRARHTPWGVYIFSTATQTSEEEEEEDFAQFRLCWYPKTLLLYKLNSFFKGDFITYDCPHVQQQTAVLNTDLPAAKNQSNHLPYMLLTAKPLKSGAPAWTLGFFRTFRCTRMRSSCSYASCVCAHGSACACVCIYIYIYICAGECVYTYVYAHMYFVFIYPPIYIHSYVHTDICLFTYIHTYIQTL